MGTTKQPPPLDPAPSHHTTRQEIEKAARFQCKKCGLTGVSAMVRNGACVNELACRKRQTKRMG